MRVSVLTALAALTAATAAAMAQEPIVLKITTGAPSVGIACKGELDVWAAQVEKASKGGLKFELYCDGLLSRNGDTYNRVAAGVADIGRDLPLVYGQRFAELAVMGLPGLYDDPVTAGGALYRAYAAGKVAGEALKDFKVIYFQASANTAFYMKTKLKSPTDFAGAKIVLGSKLRAQLVGDMKGVPLAISTAEYYQAISKGVADGAMTTVGAISDFKLDELTNTYLYGPFGGGVVMTLMNKARYDSLPPDLQKVINENSGYELSRWMSKHVLDYEDKYFETVMMKKPGAEKHVLTAEELKAWQPAFDSAAKDWVTTTPNGAAVLRAMKDALKAEGEK